MFLVLIETSGNQNYIFSTNKLKENIGASELTYRAGTSWVLEAVEQVRGASESIRQVGRWLEEAIERTFTTKEVREKLLDLEGWNKPIEAEDSKVEVILATSGKALLLTKDEDTAKSIIRYVTHKATRYAPGLDVCGVIKEFEWEQNNIGESNRQIHQKFQSVKSKRPSLDLRFLRLPVVAECSTSGFPASEFELSQVEPGDKNENRRLVYRSTISSTKKKYSFQGFERIAGLLKREKPEINFARSVRVLNEELKNIDFPVELQEATPDNRNGKEKPLRQLPWLAVVHADGNGLGEIFLNFEKHLDYSTINRCLANRNYVDKLRKFSIALDICTENSFLSALSAFPSLKEGLLPIIPLILGGDDLTVICDGRAALKFTQMFLTEFEKETKCPKHLDGIIPEVAGKALKAERLSACAGVAIIKNHFPFSVAYELAETLMKSAKPVKKKVTKEGKPYPCSALDFHILYDSSDVELKKIREKIELTKGGVKTKLYNKPYVVTPLADIQEANGLNWAQFHQWKKLQEKVDAILAPDPKNKEKRLFPNSQIHELRAGLFLGKEGSDARYKLIKGRYEGMEKLEGEPESLFEKEETDSEIYTTGLLDAIDAADFLQLGDQNYEQ